MFRKYEKTYRVITQNFNVSGKLNLSSADQKKLLNGKVEITEKVDGANVGIVRGKKDKWTLQKRRGLADSGVHAQFSFFWNWARANQEKILQIPENYIVYGELCFAVHHIYYNQLPSYFVVFDVWNGKRYLDHNDRINMVKDLGFQHVPVLHYGSIETLEVEKFVTKSSFSSSSLMEGIVIKNHKKQMRGKLVRPEFVKELNEDEDHWMSKSVKRNKLREGVDWRN